MFSAWRKKTLSVRLIAITLTIAFIHQDIVWAQEGTPVWSKPVPTSEKLGQSPSGRVPIFPNNNLNANIALPKDVAVTKEVYKSNNGDNKTIINIQDAHSSLAAQESITSILDSLVTNYDLKLVAIEGSSGYIDTSILKTFPDENIRKSTAKHLMAKGKMSAGEFYSITSNKQIALYGIEDRLLYKENVEQFRKIYEINQIVSKDIDNLLKTLNILQDKIYSKELKQLESNSVLKKDGALSFTNRWNYVDNLAAKLDISYDNYPNLKKLVASIKLEKNISFDTANKERDALIDVISKSAAKDDLEKLVLKSLSFKQGKISQGEYYLFLHGLAKDYSIDPNPYKNLIRFTDYITLYESIDLLEIFEEAKLLEDAIKDKLYTNPGQKKLHDILKCVNYIKDIFELKLTNADFADLEKSLETVNAEYVAEFIKKIGTVPVGDSPQFSYSLDNIYSNLPIAIDFYRTAEKRNNAILENTIERMNKEGQSVAALITGGYHTKGISELLKQKETSYLVILPKFDTSKGERPYVAILTNKADNYSEEIENGKYTTLSESYIKESINNPATVLKFVREIIRTNLTEAKKQGKDVHSIANLWIEGYRQSYEELKTKGIIKEGTPSASLQANEVRKIGTVPEGDCPIFPEAISKSNGNDKNLAVTSVFPQNGLTIPQTPPAAVVESEVREEEYKLNTGAQEESIAELAARVARERKLAPEDAVKIAARRRGIVISAEEMTQLKNIVAGLIAEVAEETKAPAFEKAPAPATYGGSTEEEKINSTIEKVTALPEFYALRDEVKEFLKGFSGAMPLEHRQAVTQAPVTEAPKRLHAQLLNAARYYKSLKGDAEIAFDVTNPDDDSGQPVGHTDIMFVAKNKEGLTQELTGIIEKQGGSIPMWGYIHAGVIIIVIESKKGGAPFLLEELDTLRQKISAIESEEGIIKGTGSSVQKVIFGVTDRLKTIHGIDVYGEFVAHPWDKDAQRTLKIGREIEYYLDTVEIVKGMAATNEKEKRLLNRLEDKIILSIRSSGRRAEYCFIDAIEKLKNEMRNGEHKDELDKFREKVITALAKWESIDDSEIDAEIALFDAAKERVQNEWKEQEAAFRRAGKEDYANRIYAAYVDGLEPECDRVKERIRNEKKRARVFVKAKAKEIKGLYSGSGYDSHLRATLEEMYNVWNTMIHYLHRVDDLTAGKVSGSELRKRILYNQGRARYAVSILNKEMASGNRFYLPEFVAEIKEKAGVIITKEKVTAVSAIHKLAKARMAEIGSRGGISQAEMESMRRGVWLATDRITEIIEGGYVGEDNGAADNIVLIAETMDSSTVWKIKRNRPNVKVLVCPTGNPATHYVVAAEQAGLSIIAGAHLKGIAPLKPVTEILGPEVNVIVDTAKGIIIPNPSVHTIDEYSEKMAAAARREKFYENEAADTARTVDGTELNVTADVANLNQIDEAMKKGAGGIGLYRTEWLYDGATKPEVPEMEAIFLAASDRLGPGKPLTLRLLDMRNDKRPSTLDRSDKTGCAYYFEDEEGCLVVRNELRAMFRAYARSKYKNIEILFPMVSSEYIPKIDALLKEIRAEIVGKDGIEEKDLDGLEIGGMIETPLAVMQSASIINYFHFVKIGMSDLSATSIEGADRDSEESAKAFSTLNPFVFSELIFVAEQAKVVEEETGKKKRVGICGIWPNSPRFDLFVLRLMDIFPDISVTPNIYCIPRLKGIIRNTTKAKCVELFKMIPSVISKKQAQITAKDLDELAQAKEDNIETRILNGDKYRMWRQNQAMLGNATLRVVADWFAKHGLGRYSPFFHAPVIEELKVAIPIALKNLIGLSAGWFGSVLGLFAIAFVALHIFNERLPGSRKEIPSWFLKVFAAPTLAAISGIAILYYLSSNPCGAILLSMAAHLGVEIGVALLNKIAERKTLNATSEPFFDRKDKIILSVVGTIGAITGLGLGSAFFMALLEGGMAAAIFGLPLVVVVGITGFLVGGFSGYAILVILTKVFTPRAPPGAVIQPPNITTSIFDKYTGIPLDTSEKIAKIRHETEELAKKLSGAGLVLPATREQFLERYGDRWWFKNKPKWVPEWIHKRIQETMIGQYAAGVEHNEVGLNPITMWSFFKAHGNRWYHWLSRLPGIGAVWLSMITVLIAPAILLAAASLKSGAPAIPAISTALSLGIIFGYFFYNLRLHLLANIVTHGIYNLPWSTLFGFAPLTLPRKKLAQARSPEETADRIVEIVSMNPDYIEEGLDEVKAHLETQGEEWNTVRAIWRILKRYNRGGHVDTPRLKQDRNKLLDQMKHALITEWFWSTYLEEIRGKSATGVSLKRIHGKMTTVTDSDFRELVRGLGRSGYIRIRKDKTVVWANFKRLADEAIEGVGIDYYEGDTRKKHPYYLDKKAREVFEEWHSGEFFVGSMQTEFSRKHHIYDETYVRTKQFVKERIQSGATAIRVAVIGSAFGMQGYDAAMAAADAVAETGISVPITVVNTDAQYASVDYGKRGSYRGGYERVPAERFKRFFRKDAAGAWIMRARDFREKWNVRLAFEKLDISSDSDTEHIRHEYGPFDVVIAMNVHYGPSWGPHDIKGLEISFWHNLDRLLDDNGLTMLDEDQGRMQPRSAAAAFAKYLDDSFTKIPAGGTGSYLEIGDAFFFMKNLRGAPIGAIIEAIEKDRRTNIGTAVFKYSQTWERALFINMIDDTLSAESKRELFEYLLYRWLIKTFDSPGMIDQSLRFRDGDRSALFKDGRKFLKPETLEKVDRFLAANEDVTQKVIAKMLWKVPDFGKWYIDPHPGEAKRKLTAGTTPSTGLKGSVSESAGAGMIPLVTRAFEKLGWDKAIKYQGVIENVIGWALNIGLGFVPQLGMGWAGFIVWGGFWAAHLIPVNGERAPPKLILTSALIALANGFALYIGMSYSPIGINLLLYAITAYIHHLANMRMLAEKKAHTLEELIRMPSTEKSIKELTKLIGINLLAMKPEEAVRVITHHLNSGGSLVRHSAEETIGSLLIDRGVRFKILSAIIPRAEIGEDAALRITMRNVNNGDPILRSMALNTLCNILDAILDNPAFEKHAFTSVEISGSKRETPFGLLLKSTVSSDKAFSDDASRHLYMIGKKVGRKRLTAYLTMQLNDRDDPDVRPAAKAALLAMSGRTKRTVSQSGGAPRGSVLVAIMAATVAIGLLIIGFVVPHTDLAAQLWNNYLYFAAADLKFAVPWLTTSAILASALFIFNKLVPRDFDILKDFVKKAFGNFLAFVKWHYSRSPIGVSEENMTSALSDRNKIEPFENTDNYSGLEGAKTHLLTSISWRPTNLSRGTFFSTSMQSRIASLILLSSVGIVLACVWQPLNEAAVAIYIPSSSRSMIIGNSYLFIFNLLVTNIYTAFLNFSQGIVGIWTALPQIANMLTLAGFGAAAMGIFLTTKVLPPQKQGLLTRLHNSLIRITGNLMLSLAILLPQPMLASMLVAAPKEEAAEKENALDKATVDSKEAKELKVSAEEFKERLIRYLNDKEKAYYEDYLTRLKVANAVSLEPILKLLLEQKEEQDRKIAKDDRKIDYALRQHALFLALFSLREIESPAYWDNLKKQVSTDKFDIDIPVIEIDNVFSQWFSDRLKLKTEPIVLSAQEYFNWARHNLLKSMEKKVFNDHTIRDILKVDISFNIAVEFESPESLSWEFLRYTDFRKNGTLTLSLPQDEFGRKKLERSLISFGNRGYVVPQLFFKVEEIDPEDPLIDFFVALNEKHKGIFNDNYDTVERARILQHIYQTFAKYQGQEQAKRIRGYSESDPILLKFYVPRLSAELVKLYVSGEKAKVSPEGFREAVALIFEDEAAIWRILAEGADGLVEDALKASLANATTQEKRTKLYATIWHAILTKPPDAEINATDFVSINYATVENNWPKSLGVIMQSPDFKGLQGSFSQALSLFFEEIARKYDKEELAKIEHVKQLVAVIYPYEHTSLETRLGILGVFTEMATPALYSDKNIPANIVAGILAMVMPEVANLKEAKDLQKYSNVNTVLRYFEFLRQSEQLYLAIGKEIKHSPLTIMADIYSDEQLSQEFRIHALAEITLRIKEFNLRAKKDGQINQRERERLDEILVKILPVVRRDIHRWERDPGEYFIFYKQTMSYFSTTKNIPSVEAPKLQVKKESLSQQEAEFLYGSSLPLWGLVAAVYKVVKNPQYDDMRPVYCEVALKAIQRYQDDGLVKEKEANYLQETIEVIKSLKDSKLLLEKQKPEPARKTDAKTRDRGGFAALEVSTVLTVIGLIAALTLSVACGIGLVGSSEFMRNWLYFASGALPQIVNMFTLGGFGAAAMAIFGKGTPSTSQRQRDIRGPNAPDTNAVIKGLVKHDRMIEVYLDGDTLKANKVEYQEKYVPSKTPSELYRGEEVKVGELFSETEISNLMKWIHAHPATGPPVKFRIVLNEPALGWRNSIENSNIAHASYHDQCIYFGHFFLKYLMADGKDREDLRKDVLDDDELQHLLHPEDIEKAHQTDAYARRLARVSEIIKLLNEVSAVRKNPGYLRDVDFRPLHEEAERMFNNTSLITEESVARLSDQYEAYLKGGEKQRKLRESLGLKDGEAIAYDSLEYAITPQLPFFAGGLGALAGDHVGAAGDLLPNNTVICFGGYYKFGYLTQRLDETGWQESAKDVNKRVRIERFGEIVKDADGNDMVIDLPMPGGKTIYTKAWKVQVGRVPLYLFTTDISENDQNPGYRKYLDYTYDSNDHIRLVQEYVVGVGSERLLQKLGIVSRGLHLNEGHVGFAILEKARQLLTKKIDFLNEKFGLDYKMETLANVPIEVRKKYGLTLLQALEAVRGSVGFTSHTPVLAGNQLFPTNIAKEYLEAYLNTFGGSFNEIAFGPMIHVHPTNPDFEVFDMTEFVITFCSKFNAVSRKHADVCRKMYKDTNRQIEESVQMRGYKRPEAFNITNAVSRAYYQPEEMAGLLERKLNELKKAEVNPIGPEVTLDEISWEDATRLVNTISDEEMAGVSRLMLENGLKELRQLAANGHRLLPLIMGKPVEIDPDAFIVVFGRRMAGYKRAGLILDPLDKNDMLTWRSIVEEAQKLGKKVQLVYMGKAHDTDVGGKAIIQKILHVAKTDGDYGPERPVLKETIIFIENYDTDVARTTVKIVTAGLNNPEAGKEASGTSGEKYVLAGKPSMSVMDGFWLEAKRGVFPFVTGKELRNIMVGPWRYMNYAGRAIQGGAGEGAGRVPTQEPEHVDGKIVYECLDPQCRNVFSVKVEEGVSQPDHCPKCGSLAIKNNSYHELGLMDIYFNHKDRWYQIMRESLIQGLAFFTSHRMFKEYASKVYAPIVESGRIAEEKYMRLGIENNKSTPRGNIRTGLETLITMPGFFTAGVTFEEFKAVREAKNKMSESAYHQELQMLQRLGIVRKAYGGPSRRYVYLLRNEIRNLSPPQRDIVINRILQMPELSRASIRWEHRERVSEIIKRNKMLINSGQAETIAKLIKKIIGPIRKNMKPADIFKRAIERVNQKTLAEKPNLRRMIKELEASVDVQHQALITTFDKNANELDEVIAQNPANQGISLAPIENSTIISGIIDTVAVEDPSFRDTVARNKANNRKTCLVWGGILGSLEKAEAFVRASRCNIEDVLLIDGRDAQHNMLTLKELSKRIQQKVPGIEEKYIGIRAAEEDNVRATDKDNAKLLLVRRVKVDGRSILLAMNSERILLHLIFAGSDAGKLKIPGLVYDDTRKAFVFEPIVPKDYGKEIESYRNAMLLLSSAA